jgi:hypothetical protein
MTMFVLALAAIGFFYYDNIQAPIEPGDITIQIVDETDQIISEEVYSFTEEDTLLAILDANHDLTCGNRNYQPTTCNPDSIFGTVILGIDDMSTNWMVDYIAIYVNNEYSTFGIDSIVLTDGDIYRFEYTLVEELTP